MECYWRSAGGIGVMLVYVGADVSVVHYFEFGNIFDKVFGLKDSGLCRLFLPENINHPSNFGA